MRAPRLLLLSLFAVAACGTPSPGSTDESGSDAGDIGTDAGSDVATQPAPAAGADSSATSPNGDAPKPTATGCQSLVHDTANVESSAADTYRWYDASCHLRSASLLRNDQKDAFGEAGGYLRSLSYQAGGATRVSSGTGVNGWQGFGYVINHYGSGASQTQGVLGETMVLLAGKHHAVHEFKWRVYAGGPIDVTAEWRVATGRDHPVFAITFDTSAAGPNVVDADTRAPYGDMAYEGAAGPISGIGWGDSHKFATTSSPVTTSTSWDYSQPNRIPYDVSWSTAGDAEMGLVSTADFATGPAGGDYGGGILAKHWGTTGTNLLADLPDWTWPYQLNQYELPFGTTSHRVAWGASYGAVGQTAYASFGRTLSGYPCTSYAVDVVFGTHQASAVAAEVAEMETTLATQLTATKGTVATSGVGGPGRTDVTPFAHAGWDALRAAWAADASSNEVSLAMDTGSSAALVNPTFVVRHWTAGEPHVAWNGAALTPDVHYFATLDAARNELWITLGFAVTSGTLDVGP